MRHRWPWLLSGLLALGVPTFAAAQSPATNFPAKPIRLITPYPPGGGTDAVARPIAQHLNKAWGQPVVVDNRGTGGGVIAATMVAGAPPDGYTLLLSTGAVMVSAPLMMGKVGFDPIKDFSPIGLATLLPAFLVTQASLPANSVPELIALAKSQPGKLTSGSSGTGGGHHLAVEMLNSMAGVKIIHVPYKGGGPAVVALLSGEITMNFANFPAVRPHIQGGRLKALATCGSKRSALLPNAPTMIESGLTEFDYTSWFGFHLPARTPRAIVEQYNTEMRRALAEKSISEPLLAVGAEAAPSSGDELLRIMREEHARWSRIIKAQNLKL